MEPKMKRINDFLDRYVLPWPVRYLTHRFVILLTIALLIPLVVYASKQVLVLLVNSYLNTMSVAVSSIVLLYATISEVHQKQLYELQEKRAQEDHIHVVEMHSLMQGSLAGQQAEIEKLREMITTLQGRPYHPRQAQPQIDLRELHPRGPDRFDASDTERRLGEHLHRHATTEQVHEKMVANEPPG
jgi:hypothetical protein